MHIPDGIIDDAPTLAATWLGSVGTLGYAIRWVRVRVSEQRTVLMAVLAALIFALQMLNFPVAGGTSGHFVGAAAAAIVLGVWPAVVVMATVLVVQAVFFLDGGLVALGPNIFNLAVVTTFTGWWTYRLITRIAGKGRASRVSAAFAAGWISVVCGASAAALEIWLSGKAPLAIALGAMAFWHALIGVGEGLITAGLVGYLVAVRPDILEPSASTARVGRLAVVLAGVALLAAAFSFAASAYPDALERVLQTAGVTPHTVSAIPFALPGYAIPGISNPALGGVLAALVGTVLAATLVWAGLSRRRPRVGAATNRAAEAESIHRHVHQHDDEPEHAHPHHHGGDASVSGADARHGHTHGSFFERYTYILSPINGLDPRAKIAACVVLVLAIVLTPPLRLIELGGLVLFFSLVTVAARLPLARIVARTAIVLPFAGVIALFAPLAQAGGSLSVGGLAGAYAGGGWIAAYAVLSKAWLSAWAVVLLTATTPVPLLFKGLKSLHAPTVVLTMLSFLYRYVGTMAEQLASLRRAMDSRGFALSRWRRLRLYGHLAGNLFIRAVERGERVHAAMVSRGYDGTMPSPDVLTLRRADALMGLTVLATAASVVLYR